jgi:hypothetical protein
LIVPEIKGPEQFVKTASPTQFGLAPAFSHPMCSCVPECEAFKTMRLHRLARLLVCDDPSLPDVPYEAEWMYARSLDQDPEKLGEADRRARAYYFLHVASQSATR